MGSAGLTLGVLSVCVDFITSNAAELVSLIIEAVRTYDDRHTIRAVLRVARVAASRSETFVKHLAAGVVKAATGSTRPGRHEAYGLLALARIAVQQCDPVAAKKAVLKLIEVQTALSEQLSNSSVRWQVRVTHCFAILERSLLGPYLYSKRLFRALGAGCSTLSVVTLYAVCACSNKQARRRLCPAPARCCRRERPACVVGTCGTVTLYAVCPCS